MTISDLFSRYKIVRKIKSATGKAISNILIKDWFETLGTPKA